MARRDHRMRRVRLDLRCGGLVGPLHDEGLARRVPPARHGTGPDLPSAGPVPASVFRARFVRLADELAEHDVGLLVLAALATLGYIVRNTRRSGEPVDDEQPDVMLGEQYTDDLLPRASSSASAGSVKRRKNR